MLACDAFVFSQTANMTPPHIGKLIHGREYATTTMRLTPLYAKVESVVTAIKAQRPTPPHHHSCSTSTVSNANIHRGAAKSRKRRTT
jgi:hypothetical protein